MNEKDSGADRCSIIDDFIGQGAAVGSESRCFDRIATSGCTILTDFSDQGQPTRGAMPSAKPTATPQSASQGCEAITTFVDEGFVPATEARNGPAKNRSVTNEQAPAKREP
jgi:hypothetical protein